jgi:hypothetical protein
VFEQDAARGGIGLDLDRFVIGQGCAGGIGAMRVIRYEDDIAMAFAPAFMIGFDEHEARQFAVRAGGWLQGDTRHARDFRQVALKLVDELDCALGCVVGLQGMQAREAGQGCHILIELGVVFHSAGAERVEARIHAEVTLREVRIVAHDLDLADLRQGRGLLAQHCGGNHAFQGFCRHIHGCHGGGSSPRRTEFKDERFDAAHARTSFKIETSVSMSSFVRVSVTQKSMSLSMPV